MFIQGINGAGGQLNQAKVNTEGQLLTRSISATEIEHSIIEGDGFQSYTGVINIAGSTRQSVFYIKNNDTNDIMLTSATIGSSVSTGGSDNILLVENVGNVADSDAIVTAGTDIAAYNANGGSAREFVGDIKKGPQVASVNGVPVTGLLADFTSGKTFELTSIIPKGGSASVEVIAPTGNTSMDITIDLSFHVIETI